MKEPRKVLPPSLHWPLDASHALAFLMTDCFGIIAVWFMAWLFPQWDPRGMAVIVLLLSLEAMVAYRLIKKLPLVEARAPYFRVTEWILILVTLKIYMELRPGLALFIQNILLLRFHFLSSFFTNNYLLTLVVAFFVWQISTSFAADLKKLEDEQILLEEVLQPVEPARQAISRRFLLVGMILVIGTGIMIQNVFDLRRPPVSQGVMAVALLYFLLGSILLSLTHYYLLQARWTHERARVQDNLTGRWILYSALFLGVLVVLAGLLPTNYTVGLFATIRYVGQLIVYLFTIIAGIFTLLVLFLIGFWVKLFGLVKTSNPLQTEPTPVPLSAPPTPGGSSIGDMIVSILIWTLFLALLVTALRQYLRAHQELAQELKRFAWGRWLSLVLKRLKAFFQTTNHEVSSLIQAGLRRLRNPAADSRDQGGWDFSRFRRMNHRQRVFFYYLALLKRADEAGSPRQSWQTPYEYSRTLVSRLEGEEESVEAVTESFVEARYSRHEVSKEKAHQMRLNWEHLLGVLRNWQKLHRK